MDFESTLFINIYKNFEHNLISDTYEKNYDFFIIVKSYPFFRVFK